MSLYANAGVEEYLLVDYKNQIIEQYCLNGNAYMLNKSYNKNDTCTLLLYPEVNISVSDVFNPFSIK